MEAAHAHARPVRLVSVDGELVGETCSGCVALLEKIKSLKGDLTELRNAEQERLSMALDAKPIMEVLQFHKRMLAPSATIFKGKAAWKAVKKMLELTDAETGERAFSVLHLQAAVVGLSLSAWHREKKLTGAAWLFADPDRVQEFIDRCTTFKRATGVSALTIVDELMGDGLEWLAARCSCGHLRLDHERERPEFEIVHPPCAVHGCHCESFCDFDYRVERWMAERERTAS